MRKVYWLLCALLLVNNSDVLAQSSPSTTGLWIAGFGNVMLHKNWSFIYDAQYRSFEISPNIEQLLLRGGVSYRLNNTSSAGIGYANVTNYAFEKEQPDDILSTENRLWQQLHIRHQLQSCLLEHRYRVEQRWLESENDKKYFNRIRYLARLTVPLNKNESEKNIWFLVFYDEVFIQFSDTPFDRNRLSASIGYKLNANVNFQLGYLAQTVNTKTKHILQTGVYCNFDLRK
jgi:Protein of unknown function (DUF2490)